MQLGDEGLQVFGCRLCQHSCPKTPWILGSLFLLHCYTMTRQREIQSLSGKHCAESPRLKAKSTTRPLCDLAKRWGFGCVRANFVCKGKPDPAACSTQEGSLQKGRVQEHWTEIPATFPRCQNGTLQEPVAKDPRGPAPAQSSLGVVGWVSFCSGDTVQGFKRCTEA